MTIIIVCGASVNSVYAFKVNLAVSQRLYLVRFKTGTVTTDRKSSCATCFMCVFINNILESIIEYGNRSLAMGLEKNELFEPVMTHKVSYFLERLITCQEKVVLLILDNVLLIAEASLCFAPLGH